MEVKKIYSVQHVELDKTNFHGAVVFTLRYGVVEEFRPRGSGVCSFGCASELRSNAGHSICTQMNYKIGH